MTPDPGMTWQEGLVWFGAALSLMVAAFALWGWWLLRPSNWPGWEPKSSVRASRRRS